MLCLPLEAVKSTAHAKFISRPPAKYLSGFSGICSKENVQIGRYSMKELNVITFMPDSEMLQHKI
jgi:hypothetical protein